MSIVGRKLLNNTEPFDRGYPVLKGTHWLEMNKCTMSIFQDRCAAANVMFVAIRQWLQLKF